MNFSTKYPLLLAAALLAPAQLAPAEVPNGQVNFIFGPENIPVYYLGGTLQFEQPMIGTAGTLIPLVYPVDLVQNNAGFLSGSGETWVQVDNDFVAAAYKVNGKISGGGQTTKVSLTVKLSGEDYVGGILTKFNINITYNFTVKPVTGTLEGTARGSANFSKFGSDKINTNIVTPLPPGANGVWTLQMNIVPLNQLAGSGAMVVANAIPLQTQLSGSYSTSKAQSTVKNSGINDSRGNSATVVFDSELLSVRGKVFNQSVNLTVDD